MINGYTRSYKNALSLELCKNRSPVQALAVGMTQSSVQEGPGTRGPKLVFELVLDYCILSWSLSVVLIGFVVSILLGRQAGYS